LEKKFRPVLGISKKASKNPHTFTKDPIKDVPVFRWLFEFFLRTMVICNNMAFDFLITIVISLIPIMIPEEGWVQFRMPDSLPNILLYSWLPTGTYLKKSGDLESLFFRNLANLGQIFHEKSVE
jgi:hypothetical protein